ncbi:MAG: carboxylating nicotinate-nucleotide diphosphorylase [Thermoleophilia bacterium]|nr:carboxylating nicotinate-nucleotide diphosphorylase [Thermoleophilia bacterium]
MTLAEVVRVALAEDVGTGDVTTDTLFEPGASARAEIRLKEPGVVCGLAAAEAVFAELDPAVRFEPLAADGDRIDDVPAALARLRGPARALLTGERTALNLLGRLSGIATLTRSFVDAVAGTAAVILDTRKTTPGLRALEKEAVRCGGGRNHRLGLHDAILVKDNHLALLDGIAGAVERLRAVRPDLPVEVEADTLDQVREALAAGAERILLDNMPLADMAEAARLAAGRATLEASGGVSRETVRAIAETGVDFISAGALTHSARALDVSMEVLP